MVNMSLCARDREMAKAYVKALTERRKQLCPWPFGAKEVESLYIPANLLKVRDEIADASPNFGWLFAKNTRVSLDMKNAVIMDKAFEVFIMASDGVSVWAPLSYNDSVRPCLSSPHWPAFRTWCLQAYKTEVENMVTQRTINTLFEHATTWKQVHRALPRTINALRAYVDAVDSSQPRGGSHYYFRSPRAKLREVQAALDREGSSLARRLPRETQELLRKRGDFAEEIMAQAMLLEDRQNLGEGPFRNTWVLGVKA